MSRRPTRVVDAHVHLWDPANAAWYPYLSGRQQIGMDVAGMARRFDVPTYLAEAQGWNVVALVNVAAATGAHSVEETLELDRLADADEQHLGHPDAIVGGLPPAGSVAEAIELVDRQMAAPRLRGVRPMGASADPVPADEVLRALRERGLLFELMAHPDQLQAAATRLARTDGLSVVVEHTGWPRSDDADERALWLRGIRALADVGPHVTCKLSGLAMPLGSMQADALAPWIEPAIDTFGVDRCMFASNFPVDGAHGTLDQLFTACADVVSGLDQPAVDQLFADTATRVYRLDP